MHPASFDNLTVVCRSRESRAGCAELCRNRWGETLVRIRIHAPSLQKDLLIRLSETAPVRFAEGTLELLLPSWQDGQTLEEWLRATAPDLGERRERCLSLLAGLLACPVMPELAALSANVENLRFTPQQTVLRLFPDLTAWRSDLGPQDAVRFTADLAREILTRGLTPWQRRRFPSELRLILLRCKDGAYCDWGTLQQDLAALPDTLPSPGEDLRRLLGQMQARAKRWAPALTGVTAILLTTAAVLSLAGTVYTRCTAKAQLWPGMTIVGDQVLDGEEDGTR